MKNISKHKKILMAIAAILSPVMFAAIFMFLPRINYAEGMLHIDNGDPGDMDKILSYSISHASLLIPAVLAIIVLVVNMTIAGYLIARGTNKIEKRFGYLTVIAGGLGLNTLYFAFKLFKKDTTEVKQHKGRFLMGSTIIAAPLVLTPMFGLAFYKGVDKPTAVGDVKFSTVESKPNVIEIFTDGFDPSVMKPRLTGDEHLNGFTMFDHFVTSGAETSFSFPTIMGGIKDFNIFKQKDMGASGNMEELYSSIFANSVVKHMMVDEATPVDRDRYFVNTNSMGKSASFQESSSGHPEGITDANDEYNKEHPTATAKANLQPVNFGQVKNTVTGTFGSANYAPEVMNYQFLAKKAKAESTQATEGSRYMMQEFVTHPPRLVGKDGSLVLAMGTPSVARAEDGLKTSLDRTMDMLKSLQAPADPTKPNSPLRSVYDNSMIIIYGDHANHVNPLVHNPYNPRTPETTNAEKWHSFAMIKYPNTSGNLNDQTLDENGTPVSHPVNNSQIFYAPFMNKVIGSFYEDPSKRDFITGDTNHFPTTVSSTRRLLGFFGDESMYMHFEDVNGWPTLMPGDNNGNDWVLYNDSVIKDGATVPAGGVTVNGQNIKMYKDLVDTKGMTKADASQALQDKLLEGVVW